MATAYTQGADLLRGKDLSLRITSGDTRASGIRVACCVLATSITTAMTILFMLEPVKTAFESSSTSMTVAMCLG